MAPLETHRQSAPHSAGRPPDGALAWFASTAGQGLLTVEAAAMARVLAGVPALPWCWIGLPGTAPPEASGGRGVLLRREDAGVLRFGGALRCALPLPLANESFGAVLLQHALDDGAETDALLGECERILAPGGTLWLAALNAWSPYRARWARTGLRAHVTGRWQASLRRAGFALDSVHLQWLGPRWRMDQGDVGVGMNDWLRAGIALSVNKRVHALIPPARVPSFRLQGAAHSRRLSTGAFSTGALSTSALSTSAPSTSVSWRFESLRSEQLRRDRRFGQAIIRE